ncbi:MAG TPA: DNA recombination protein RmuC [Polyangia bacterium]|nr:DNA recombination protein RmuC [Polyangia bacterium]
MELSWLAIAGVAFLIGGVSAGGLAWLLAGARGKTLAEAVAREGASRASAAEARAETLAAQARQSEARANGLEAALRQTESERSAEAARAETLARTLEDQRARNQTASEQQAREKSHEKLIEGMVAPVRASLEKVDEQIRAMERERGTAYGALRQQMQAIAETQERLRDAAGNLVGALKASTVRGRWGEMQLRRVVELAGMLEHCDFVEQATVASASGEGRLRPDMIIKLAGGRNIVVDAKVPLSAYLEAREAATDEARTAKLRLHAAQLQAHITKLSAKSYWDDLGVAPEVVVMFLPGEALYTAALEQMPGLIEEGFAQRVLVATPTTLLGLLRAISCGWREERLAENAQRISDEGRRLHERVATVLDHFGDLGRALGQAVKHFNVAMVSFERRTVVSARKLEELGARGKKDLGDRPQIDARPFSVAVSDEPRKKLAQAPLTLALSPASNDQG